MPFGLMNAGATFQRKIERATADLEAVFGYLDDLEVASKNKQEHARHLRELFLRLREHGLVINLEKCVFGVESIDFLGHRVSAAGVAPLPDHVEAVTKFPRPSTVKELQGFLGLVNFYRRFIPAAASILKPLTDSLKGGPKGAERIRLAAAQGEVFPQHQGGAGGGDDVGTPPSPRALEHRRGRVGFARGGLFAAAAAGRRSLGAAGIFLAEVGAGAGEILRLRP
jgi:hypothetical protein